MHGRCVSLKQNQVAKTEKTSALLLLYSLILLQCSCFAYGRRYTRGSFPDGFVFGAATSAYQVEGMTNGDGRGPSIWDTFVKKPGAIAKNGNADVTVDQYHRYMEDIDLMYDLNFDAYRFSISWSRILPAGTGEVNEAGVAYYNKLIAYIIEKGLTPYVTLYHFDLPEALHQKYTGLLNRQIINDFADYAEFCFKTFGDRVKNWFTFNEPRKIAALGYDVGVHPPIRCSKEYGKCTEGNSGTEPYIVGHNILLAHAEAVRRYRQKYQGTQKGTIGIHFDFDWYEPFSNNTEDQEAAQRARDFSVGWFIHPLVNGEYPKNMQDIVQDRLPNFTKEEVDTVKGSFDVLGFNHYSTAYARNQQPQVQVPSYHTDWHAELVYERNGETIGARANSPWLYVVPWGISKGLTYIKENYGNPAVVITENGMDDPGDAPLHKAIYDTIRIDFYKGYLTELKKAIDGGANVKGYFVWALLDCFEWVSGYTSRYGIVYVDFTTLKRYPKKSGYWFQKMLHRELHAPRN